jgi:hypothetical protein
LSVALKKGKLIALQIRPYLQKCEQSNALEQEIWIAVNRLEFGQSSAVYPRVFKFASSQPSMHVREFIESQHVPVLAPDLGALSSVFAFPEKQ